MKRRKGFELRQNTINWSSPFEYKAPLARNDGVPECRCCARFKPCTSGRCKGWCDSKVTVEIDAGRSPGWCPRKRCR